MPSPTDNGLHSGSPSPIADQGDDGDAANDDQGQNWLTIRRRCELCKQRKVRFSKIAASVELARSNPRLIANPYISRSWCSHGPPTVLHGRSWVSGCVGRRWELRSASEPMQPSHRHHILSDHRLLFTFRRFEFSASLYVL
jgi:hypothetical protein